MKKSIACLLFVFMIPVSGFTAESDLKEIHFVSESWEGITNQDGTGLCWELFRRIYEPDIRMKFETLPYARSAHMVQTGQTDAVVGVYRDEFDGVLFSQWHYLQDIILVIFKKGAVEKWEGEKSLRGNTGWMRGYAFNEYLQARIEKIYETDSRESALKMLEKGRLDFFLDTEQELNEALKKNIIPVENFQVETIFRLNVYLAFAENEKGQKLMNVFDEKMEILVKSGELKPLYKKWNKKYPFDE